MEINEDEFYRAASIIARKSIEGKFATKSPALLLPSEHKDGIREAYYQALLKRIKNQKQKTDYLFSLPYLKSELRKMPKKETEKILNWWQILLTYKNLDLRLSEAAFDPCIIGDMQILVKDGQKRFLLPPGSPKAVEVKKTFSRTFKHSMKSSKLSIEEIKNSL